MYLIHPENKGNLSNVECCLDFVQIITKFYLCEGFVSSSVFMSNLLRQGAAVLLRHAFPHRLLDRLDLLAQ